MTASTATRRPATDPDTAARIRERGDKIRAAGGDKLSDAQIRHLLQREGFPLAGIAAYLRGEDKPQEPQKAPQKPPASAPTPSRGRSGGATGGGLWQAPGTTSGVLLALVCYPAFLSYLRGGGPGLKAWWRAKFLNQTATDPGIANEAWFVPSTGSAASSGTGVLGTSFTGRRRAHSAPPAGAGAAAVAFARAQIGDPYQWGAEGPDRWDCSGLTQAAWRAAGVRIPRTTTLQLATLPRVRRADLAPGDLVFPEPTHVQIYAGGGRIIEAPHTGLKVREVPLGPIFAIRRPRLPARAKGVTV